MAMRSVGFQLKTEGKAEVRNDFVEVKAAGVDAMTSIGDAAERSADRSTKAAADAAERQARSYAKIAAAAHTSGLQTPVQRTYDTPRAATEDLSVVKAAAALRAEIDPLWAAEQKLANELERIARIEKLGVLSTQELATAQTVARKRFDETTDAIKRQSGAGGGLSKNQKQTLIYTASDIIGSSANGINPTQLLIQQGPQVLQAFAAEEGGLLKLRALINPVTVGIAGLTVATAIGAAAWLDHSSAMAKANAIAMGSGRALGLSGAALEANAEAAAKAGDLTVQAARDIELSYVQASGIGGDVLVKLTSITKDFAAATGQDVPSATKALGAALADPIAGAGELAERYGWINSATADYIAKLVEQNDKQGAQRVLTDAIADATQGAADKANVLAQGWDHVAQSASFAWNWIGKAIDRMVTGGSVANQIKDLQEQRDRGPSVGQMLMGTSTTSYRADIDRQIAKLQADARQKDAADTTAKLTATRAQGLSIANNYAGDQRDGYRTTIGKLRGALAANPSAEERAQLTETLSAYTHAVDTFIPKQEKANQLAALDAKIAATKSPSAKAALATERARVEMSGQVIDKSSAETMALSRGDRARAQSTKSGDKHAESLARQAASMEVNAAAALDVADAYLKSSSAGVVAEARRKASTDATRKGIDVDAQMRRQLNLSISDSVANTAKTIAGLRDETVARKEANDNVGAGTMTVEQMNQALSDETALRPLLAAATVAQAQGMTAAYDSIMRAVTAYRGALADAHAEEARSGAGEAISASRRTVAELRASILGMSGTPLEQSIAAARRAAEQEADTKRYVGADRKTFVDTKVDEARAGYAQAQASYILDTLRGQQDSIALSERELQLAGANDNTRDSELEKLRLTLQIRRQFPDMAATDVAQILAGVDAQQAVNEKLKITAAAIDEVRGYGNQFVDEVLSEDTWSSWGNAGKTIINSLKSEFIKLALLNPLKNLINGNSNLPTITSAFSSIGKLFGGTAAVTSHTIGPPGNATGTASFSGGLTYVNENGGEIMDLPTGTRIYPAAESRRMMQAANDGGSGRMRVDIGLNTELLTATVSGIADQRVGAAAPGIAAGGAQLGKMEMSKARRRQLGRRS